VAAKKNGFETTSWSWEEAYGILQKTQSDPHSPETKGKWRDLSTAVRFLLEKDVGRLIRGRTYLPPAKTEHSFRPGAVRRISRQEFEVSLNTGDFLGAETPLTELFEREWSSGGRKIRVKWAADDPAAYVLKAHFHSARSYVDHRHRQLVIANFSWTKTVAHELGHVLGFDDHYYSVWHGENCYYTQESRVSDLMSNSETGRVTHGHWELLEKAYPWKAPALSSPFPYFFKQ
jgi:hypothetical protein